MRICRRYTKLWVSSCNNYVEVRLTLVVITGRTLISLGEIGAGLEVKTLVTTGNRNTVVVGQVPSACQHGSTSSTHVCWAEPG